MIIIIITPIEQKISDSLVDCSNLGNSLLKYGPRDVNWRIKGSGASAEARLVAVGNRSEMAIIHEVHEIGLVN